jgi:hypothetical protein
METTVDLRRTGRRGEGDAFRDKITLQPYSEITVDGLGMGKGRRFIGALENFELLPAASVAAGTAKLVNTVGVGTEVVARAASGGVRLTTQATTPADNDDAMVVGVATTGHDVLVNANTKVHFHAAVSLPQITACLAAAGLAEVINSIQPGDETGDAAFFMFDPGEDVTTGLTTAQHANWILVQVIAGTATYTETSIQVNVDQQYDLRIEYDKDRKPTFIIDGETQSTLSAQTDAQSLHSKVGVETTAAAQKSIDVGFIDVSRALT